MTEWLLAAAIGVLAAAIPYVRLASPSPAARAALAALRALALTLLLALLLDAPLGRAVPPAPWVFVDGSLSMSRGGAGAELGRAAWDTARSIAAESTFVFGDSVRPYVPGAETRGAPFPPAGDATTSLRPVVERSMASSRPIVLITDGEVRDSSALEGLAAGSRVVVLPRPAQRDIAVATMDAPRAAVAGDSIAVRVTLSAAGGGGEEGELVLRVGDATLGRWPVTEMPAWGERQLELRARVGAAQGATVLRAIITSVGDTERRNDTLAVALEVSRAASAVFISTSPDQDSRFALAILRGALSLPTRGFLRVAPGMWRHEGSLTPASEAEVRASLREAPIAMLHGDTAVFGAPRAVTLGPLALIAPADAEGEWYPVAAPISPLSDALAALPMDSLPPVAAGPVAPGDWTALEVRRGREATRRAIVTGRDAPRRVVTVTGSGFWRWRFRGGSSADAFAALWGGIFDWLAAERADRRGAVPAEGVLRAGQPIRWRRGSASDSLVRLVLTRRGMPGDALTLRFPTGSAIQESPPLAPGLYEAIVPGGRVLLVVNASAELLPARARLRSGEVGGRTGADDTRGARRAGWPYVLVVLLLCAEWIARRRAGLR